MSLSRFSRRSFLIGLAGTAAAIVAGYSLRRHARLIRDQVWAQFRPSVKVGNLSSLDSAEPFDVCIIGSGPAGAVLGNDLVNQGFRTLILESGPDLYSDAPDARIKELEVFRNSGTIAYPIAASRMRALGGTSNIWTGRCSRLHPIDFEKNAYTPEGAVWPITYAELEPYYERAERTLQVRGGSLSKYHAPRKSDLPLSGGADLSALKTLMEEVGITVDGSPTSTGNYSSGPIRAATDLLPAFSESPNATLISGVTVTRLIAESNGHISGVEVQNLDKQVKVVQAKVYVVACGALESARLLLLSRSKEFPNGIGNTHDQVGRYFIEHPSIIFGGTIPSLKSPPSFQIGRSHQFYDEFKRQGFGSVILVFYWDPEQPKRFQIGATLEMHPSEKNRVTLASDSTDYFGNPVLDLSLSFTENDLKTLDHIRSLVQKIFADLGATKKIREDDISWSHHHIGTCRMGENPTTSVVDGNLRLHQSPNLYILGSAVFVTGGAAHPTLAITALAHRLAEHLNTVVDHKTDEMNQISQRERVAMFG